MVKEYTYVNIREVLSRVLRHPLLSDVTLEQAIQYTLDFIGINGLPNTYQDKEEVVSIENYRGKLPCDLISINQVKDCKTGICMRYMTDNFHPDDSYAQELTFKAQGRVLYTSFKTGEVLVSYKSIPVDDDGLPLLIDNANYLKALELYIKKEVFTYLFDMGKIQPAVLQNTKQDYAWAAAQLHSEFVIPSVSEMESIARMWSSLVPRTSEFEKGFKHLGDKEYIRRH